MHGRTMMALGVAMLAAMATGGAAAQDYGYGAYAAPGNRVVCGSSDGRSQRCDIGPGAEVRLARQLSRSACVRGQTWGNDNRGIWVTAGCRAEFDVAYRGQGGWQQGNAARVLRCESNDGRTRRCEVPRGSDVRLVRQLSSARCIEGSTWARERDGVWVSRGCRAEFAVMPSRGRGARGQHRGHRDQYGYGEPGVGQGRTLRCESRDGRASQCRADVRQGVQLVRELSSTRCIEGRNWGWDRSGVWVDGGCRAEFSVW